MKKRLHSLLREALLDLGLCAANRKKYVIDMSVWARHSGKKCLVCLAGAWLVKEGLEKEFWQVGDNEAARLAFVINRLRSGRWTQPMRNSMALVVNTA